MSVNDPIVVEFYENRGTWIIKRGNETFYYRCPDREDPLHWKESCFLCSHQDEMIEFGQQQDAIAYAISELGARNLEIEMREDE